MISEQIYVDLNSSKRRLSFTIEIHLIWEWLDSVLINVLSKIISKYATIIMMESNLWKIGVIRLTRALVLGESVFPKIRLIPISKVSMISSENRDNGLDNSQVLSILISTLWFSQ